MKDICPFKLENNLVTIDASILTYPTFKNIYDSDKSHNKELAYKYFTYIYHAASKACIPYKKGFSLKETQEYCMHVSNLEGRIIPLMVNKAIEYYKATFVSVSESMLANLNTNINNSDKILTRINELIEEKLSTDKLTTSEITDLLKLQKEIYSITDQFGLQLDTLIKLKATIEAENNNNGARLARGKKQITDGMRGDGEIEN